MINPVVWFEVLGQNADNLRSFYHELLGWEFNTDNPLNYGVVEAPNGGIGGGVGEVLEGRGWTTFYTKVSDLDACVQRARDMGSRVLLPINDLPGGRLAVVTDPEGNPVGLCADL